MEEHATAVLISLHSVVQASVGENAFQAQRILELLSNVDESGLAAFKIGSILLHTLLTSLGDLTRAVSFENGLARVFPNADSLQPHRERADLPCVRRPQRWRIPKG